ncbi:MAG: hypothetical protein MUO82_00930 [Candidatus Thermoplasmatota archaeon]|nr:hypothetical protein [Candidatus Thermoplasmatota archaeon]
MWKKIIFLMIAFVIIGLSFPLIAAEKSSKNSSPEFEVGLESYIGFGLSYHGLSISVKNIGDSTAHNVTLINLSIDGNVLYNNRVTTGWMDVEPGTTAFIYPNSMFFGFGRFTATMTVTCDEGITGTGSGNGFIFGPFVFVP